MMIYLSMIDSPEGQSKFTKLYQNYKHLMYRVADEILHNHHDAEDAVHQAFLSIAEHIDDVDVSIPQRTRSYVVTITENKAIDLYRVKQRRSAVELDAEVIGVQIEYEGSNALAKCMSQLPPRYRELLILKYVHSYTFKETAKNMGITEVNAKKIALRAKDKLAAMCKEEGLL